MCICNLSGNCQIGRLTGVLKMNEIINYFIFKRKIKTNTYVVNEKTKG